MTARETSSRRLPVHERFYAWQGEGVHMGRAAFFIRLYGCPVQCPWCDSAGTWHPEYIPRDLDRIEPEALADEAQASGAAFVVVTGGEPAIHDLHPLTAALHTRGMRVHLETSGTFPLQGTFDWVTLSPKWARLPLRELLREADELKLIVDAPDAIDRWLAWMGDDLQSDHAWLHPEWSQRANPEILQVIGDTVKTKGDPFRAGWQLHKLYRIDEQDPRSRPAVPLGGNPDLGV